MEFPSVSVNWLSKTCGITHARVTEMLLTVPSTGKRAGHPVYSLESALPAIISALQAPSDPGQMSPRSRRDHFAAERAELALHREKREVLPVAAVEQGISRAYHTVRESLDALPDTIERKTGLSPTAALLARDIIDATLQDLSDKLQAAYEAAVKITPDELAAQGRELLAADRGDANISDLL